VDRLHQGRSSVAAHRGARAAQLLASAITDRGGPPAARFHGGPAQHAAMVATRLNNGKNVRRRVGRFRWLPLAATATNLVVR